MSAAIDGDTSSISTSYAGSWSTELTRTPVSIVPPWRSMSATNASAIDCEPPCATTQPLAWQAAISMSPTALVIGRSRRENACAAMPAQSALVSSVLHVRATAVAGTSAPAPKRTNVNGWRGTRSAGCEASANRSSKCSVGWSNTRRQR